MTLTKIVKVVTSEIHILMAFLVIVGGLAIFIEVADEVIEGEAMSIDETIMMAVRAYRPPWLTTIMRDTTALGSVAVLTIIVVAVAVFLILQKRIFYTVLILIATSLGGALVIVLKAFFSIERPDIPLNPLLTETSPGFPSGHAAMSAVVYLSLAIILTRTLSTFKTRLYVLFMAIVLAFLIGVSRIFLGVHYPSDVLAGWAIGLAWACLCWLISRYFERRREHSP
jgi:undecaprenyl-diphosphatase